jgi:cytochrome c biogenesis protein CcdA/thiol-disulfide isomerase/thioredoxin
MALLTVFAFLAGAATAISPCVLPVLPALLAASAAGGRRRPLGIVIGLSVTFTLVIVGLAEVVDGVGLGDGVTRYVAIGVLAAAGFVLLVPAVGDRLEAPLSRLARFGPQSGGDGFWSGIGVGAALGFLYTPCAGPILAAVISVGAATGETVVIGAAYAVGSGLVLLVLTLVGRRLLAPLRRGNRLGTLQRVTGAVLVVTAVAMVFQFDIRFQESIADDFGGLTLTGRLEQSDAVQQRLKDLQGAPTFAAHPGAEPSSLPILGDAPEFVGNQRWFNTPGDAPLTMAGLRGKVVLIDFWTYTCINCIRTLPYVTAWDRTYRDQGLVVVGVHSPEFAFEKDAGNVARAIDADGIGYAVAQDNDLETWRAWGNQAWPAKYLVDAQGRVRYAHIGEGEYDETEDAIRALLAEAGADTPGEDRAEPGKTIEPGVEATPETYLGTQRAAGFTQRPKLGTHAYTATPGDALDTSRFSLGGIWTHGPEAARAGIGATLSARVRGRDVYLVLSPPDGRPGRVQVSVDGRVTKTVVVRRQRLYTLAHFAQTGTHVLDLRFEPGVAGYAFTFG